MRRAVSDPACVFGTALNFDYNRTPADSVRPVQLMTQVDTNDGNKRRKVEQDQDKIVD